MNNNALYSGMPFDLYSLLVEEPAPPIEQPQPTSLVEQSKEESFYLEQDNVKIGR